MPVAPDLAKTVKVGSDHSKNLTSVFYGAKNEKLSIRNVIRHWNVPAFQSVTSLDRAHSSTRHTFLSTLRHPRVPM